MKKLLRLLKLLNIFLLLILISGCGNVFGGTSGVASIGVSTDGRYIITAHGRDELVLWDIEKKEKKILAKNANSFSAYFIPDSHEFMWQDTDNIVHIQNVNAQEIKQFPHFETEGHLMTADKSFYLSADKWGKLYKGYGNNLTPIYTDTPIGSFQPYNLSIAGNYILSTTLTHSPNKITATTNLTVNPVNPSEYKKSSYDGVTLWNKTTLKPIARLWGTGGNSSGLLSPDGKWAVVGSTQGGHFMWLVENPHKRLSLAEIDNGWYNPNLKGYDTSKLLPMPEKFKKMQKAALFDVLAVAFISDKDFILIDDNKYARIHPIYTVGDPWIKAYVDLGDREKMSYSNLSIGSSYKANILVITKGNGIVVFHYNPKTRELEKIWEAD